MEVLKADLEQFDIEYVEHYKPIWLKAKLNDSDDLVSVANALKEKGLKTLSTVSPTDFPDENRIEMNYFFEDLRSKRNVWLKCNIPREVEACRIASLTEAFPAANWHEREAYSMFGVTFVGHPDLRPIIVSEDFVGKTPFRRDFDWDKHEQDVVQNIKTIVEGFKSEQANNEINLDTESSETVLNWGPTHPASGPIRLRIHCDGEEIISIDPDIGYVWRALEHLVTKKDFVGAIVAVERLCFMDNINSMTGYCMAVEEIAGTEITEFAKWMRVLLGEVARVSSHFMGLGGFFNNLGLHTLGLWNMDVREYFLDFLESYSGARIATAAIEPGGVRYGLDMAMLDELQKALDKFDATVEDTYMIFVNNPTMKMRAKEVGILTDEEVEAYGLCGIVARASGVRTDIRIDEPYAAYDQVEMEYVTKEGGAAVDRFTVIFEELKQSIDIIKQAKKRIEEGVASGEFNPTKDHMVKVPKKLPKGEALSRVEWARGEVLMHFVTEEKAKSPYRLKMKAPSFNHTMMLNHLLAGETLSDVPLVFGSLYVCQGDLDR
ncbi:NADH-quinone oxidoreductase subunit C [Sulfurovum sp. NBC37-1]|uniref:NADH-quinone oxidoreductase subunit D-related protein n=1 Tax=Sulfurovum sp. (strain NBC37-1) TaxID=387093 RepID=UPI0001587525|nr:NADH-quinone oxidoreductase subunit C [Sulfurovum sp. NBC37-1]BAF71804.1 NADH-quinone oxidoreductase, chain D [Sulfurovum sp. NBC37-1]